ncbi:uncharacterized protein LTHEOB_1289 [Lasiodiplodia theobromae]|uniref:uncharacterized protein n=1 Tax=Lasiodiplodia theobromae TaxID=45133 RepID=UPI0015C3C75A|nr:uncharacterized protein LTHEOB_1289 [Lasiodiplodia theobromae]KAF4538935.1 hypothetical protein LTHEOB_1289 [Lasiodiplodia theobromae]
MSVTMTDRENDSTYGTRRRRSRPSNVPVEGGKVLASVPTLLKIRPKRELWSKYRFRDSDEEDEGYDEEDGRSDKENQVRSPAAALQYDNSNDTRVEEPILPAPITVTNITHPTPRTLSTTYNEGNLRNHPTYWRAHLPGFSPTQGQSQVLLPHRDPADQHRNLPSGGSVRNKDRNSSSLPHEGSYDTVSTTIVTGKQRRPAAETATRAGTDIGTVARLRRFFSTRAKVMKADQRRERAAALIKDEGEGQPSMEAMGAVIAGAEKREQSVIERVVGSGGDIAASPPLSSANRGSIGSQSSGDSIADVMDCASSLVAEVSGITADMSAEVGGGEEGAPPLIMTPDAEKLRRQQQRQQGMLRTSRRLQRKSIDPWQGRSTRFNIPGNALRVPADSLVGHAVRVLTRSGTWRKSGRDSLFNACKRYKSEPDLSRSEGPAVKAIAQMWAMRKGPSGPSPLALRVLQWVVENEGYGAAALGRTWEGEHIDDLPLVKAGWFSAVTVREQIRLMAVKEQMQDEWEERVWAETLGKEKKDGGDEEETRSVWSTESVSDSVLYRMRGSNGSRQGIFLKDFDDPTMRFKIEEYQAQVEALRAEREDRVSLDAMGNDD